MGNIKISDIIAKDGGAVLVKVQNITDNKVAPPDNEKSTETNFWQRLYTKRKKKKSNEIMSFRSLFRFATLIDLLYLIFAIIASLALGITIPLSMVIFGASIDAFTDRAIYLCSFNLTSLAQLYCQPDVVLTSTNFYSSMSQCNFTGLNITNIDYNVNDRIKKQIMYSILIGCTALICGYIRTALWNLLAERQIRIIRQTLFRSILRKDIDYFDRHKTGELSTCLTDDINKIHAGIGDKFGTAIEIASTFTSCLIIGLVIGWKLTLVVLSMLPIIFLAIMIPSKIIAKMISKELNAYGKAGGVAEEVISSIRTVLSYNGQQRETQRYEQHLNDAKKSGINKGAVEGITNGFMLLLIYCIFALGFWYGAKLVREENYSIGNVFTIFMGIYMGVLSLEQASPFFQAITQARVAAYIIWQIIDEPSKINNNSEEGFKKDNLIGNIQFSNVQFSYPSRSDVSILNGLSFNVTHGQTIAIVGSSGSGKSTCVQLLQRFYDYQSGSILIDGKQIQQYNLKWLRQHIGVVSQEPILFQTTIRENILFGCDSATEEDIHEAAKMANAHDFIMTLPDKYETLVGERGAALSGGQKQRIAIARALLRNPKILLLDEATSALDNESEKIVQDALDRAAEGRTTLIIAHRLSTIRYADRIIVLQQGRVVEEGDHNSLMQVHGVYFGLVEQQNLHQIEDEEKSIFENHEPNQILLPNLDDLDVRRRRRSVISLTSSISSTMHVRRNSNVAAEKEEIMSNITLKILKANKPEWMFIVMGCIAAFFNGALEPTSAIVQTKLVTAFQECDINAQEQQVLICVLVYVCFGVLGLVVQSSQIFMFACSGEALTKRLRSKTFRAILRQDIAYFDQAKHNTGALCTYLATGASTVQGASGVRLGIIFQNIVTIGLGILIGFIFSWQLTLLMIAFLPMIIFGAVLQIRLMDNFAEKDKEFLEDAGKVAVEAIQNIRTVVQLSKEEHFYNEYSDLLDTVYRSARKRVHILSSVYALTSAVFFFAMAALIALGASLINQGVITFQDFFMVFDSVALTARIVSQTLTLSPDYGKALEAAEKIFKLLNRTSTIDNGSNSDDKISNFNGQLEFDHVHFIYPNRPESIILKNFKFNIEPGQKVALVGTSGCGKSTIIQLIERFYDVNHGHLLADSRDIRSLNLQWYRSQIGIVSQEPILFDMSIRENISYGDNSRTDIPLEEIIEAAKKANIHNFVKLLPDGYETNCGAKGIQLSGGQKQRIAIARALIRNPKILLLDEATSALDSESEKIVQEALDRAQQNRTSITIAHRLSTIQNADMICVLHDGVIVESGTHEELLARGGRYYRLALGKLN